MLLDGTAYFRQLPHLLRANVPFHRCLADTRITLKAVSFKT
jgi:hypothetical protein